MRHLILIIAALSAACPSVASAAGKVALVVGNARYGDSVGALVNPERDADLVADALERRGFNVTRIANADRLQLLAALDRHARALAAAGPGAIGFFYYSGHGVANPETRRNYLIPVDAASAGDDRLWYQSVPLDDVVSSLTERARGATNLIVFDACRDQLALPRQRGLGSAKGLERMEARESTLIAYSTAPNRAAADIDAAARTGPYATELAKALLTGGVDVRTMFENVKFGVLARTGRKQQPWVEDGLADRIFLDATPIVAGAIAGPAAVPPSRMAPTTVAEAPPAIVTTDPAEDAYATGYRSWAAGNFRQAQEQLKAVVARYPGHRRASYAQNMLGRAYLDDGKPALASIAFFDSYKKMPAGERAPDSLYYLGRALRTLNKPAEACKVYAKLNEVYGATMDGSLKALTAQARNETGCR